MPLRATLGAWKAEAVKNNVEYIYLKDDEVAKKRSGYVDYSSLLFG